MEGHNQVACYYLFLFYIGECRTLEAFNFFYEFVLLLQNLN